ncbi:hypothetical protein BMS_2083 [Halobacteriovorax marinus SJ]|uniref:Uncharacterized protein n=1 Tax=Halobacteriovorax marinus (strain ATCC BAA-682 / DSM 15412 / SJ) TaxID=862908 RepID=E1X364_HALMS|nr:hypothetical protein [Halobacteriovorax marinus]CBW26894.1 hypothetical protein BMS_2083 [Halobacteriovorax marinus SJ]
MAEINKSSNIIVYCGNDKGYFQSLEQRFKQRYESLNFSFVISFTEDESSYLSLLVDILKLNPKIIYIDFSVNTKSFLKLSRQLKRLSTLDHVPIVGLVESKKYLRECSASGVDFTHVKCGEIHDVVYHPMYVAFEKQVAKPTFAKGKFKAPVSASLINDFRVGYITPEYIRAEGNFHQSKGDVLELSTSFPKETIPSKQFIVNSVSDSDLYYDFDYSYELGIQFVSEPSISEADLETANALEDPKAKENRLTELQNNLKIKQEEHANEVRVCKKKHLAWVNDKITFSNPKKTKILIFDGEMNFLDSVKTSLDQFPYTIRLQTVLTEDVESLRKVFPHLIGMNLISKTFLDKFNNPNLTLVEKEALEEELKERETNSLNHLGRLVKRVKDTENYTPFIIVFNCLNFTSKSLQDTYEYPLIISHKGKMDLDYILKMAEIFERKQVDKYNAKVEAKIASLRKKDPKKYGRITKADFEEKRYYVNKNDDMSFLSLTHDIEVLTISETEITFKSERQLSPSTYRFDVPLKCSVTIVPTDGNYFQKDGQDFIYKAFIHSVDEIDKKGIRKYVNDTFFADLNEKRDKELQEFKNLNNSILEEKKSKEEKSVEETLEEINNDRDEEARPKDNSSIGFSRKLKDD